MGIIIETENLSKVYNPGRLNKVRAITDVNMKIESRDVVIIEGPSGSGKTTLLSLIGVLDTPTSGRVIIDGDDTAGLSDFMLAKLRREKIGVIYQMFNLIPGLMAWENVSYPLIPLGVNRKERKKRALQLLERLGIGHRAEHKIEEMSGGEQQRVCIARSLINDPKIVIADEPSSNIDTKTAEKVLDIFEELNKDGKTLIISTHDALISKIGKTVFRLRDGRIEKVKK